MTITYETGTYKMGGMEFKLRKASGCAIPVQIMHRRVGSPWWDIAYGENDHSQSEWDAIKRDGERI